MNSRDENSRRCRAAGRAAWIATVVLTAISFVPSLCAQGVLTVAADGSGEFNTLQAAVDSVPRDSRRRIIILVKNGTYREQVRISQSFLTIRGEDRKRTQIVAEVDTSACPISPDQSKEEHCATILAEGSDLVFEHLTVENPYKGSGKGAALSVVGDATHIVVSDVDVVGYGGDTLVLSARRDRIGDGGEYYLNNVYVSGTYHILVPRGTTYAVNCAFWCLGGTRNCLFAEGITRETDKLVVRNSAIDGPEPFGLGSYFRDAAWYFIEDTIHNVRPDGQIRREPAKNYEMKWGEGRIYFAGNKAPDYAWLRDNIEQSPAKSKARVTAAWTLANWNPESTAAPFVTGVQVSADEIRVIFSENVTVTGTPRLKLTSGAIAHFVSGNGTNVLTFRGGRGRRPLSFDVDAATIIASAASLWPRRADLSLARTRISQ